MTRHSKMLARVLPDESEVVRYCVEVMTVIALRFRRRASRQLLLDYLGELLPAAAEVCRANLTLLGGFALGVLADEVQSDEKWAQVCWLLPSSSPAFSRRWT